MKLLFNVAIAILTMSLYGNAQTRLDPEIRNLEKEQMKDLTYKMKQFALKDTGYRKGFFIGTSVGISGSNIQIATKDQRATDLGLNWKIGYMIKSNLAVLLNGSASIYNYSL